jgi:hypothetical protein
MATFAFADTTLLNISLDSQINTGSGDAIVGSSNPVVTFPGNEGDHLGTQYTITAAGGYDGPNIYFDRAGYAPINIVVNQQTDPGHMCIMQVDTKAIAPSGGWYSDCNFFVTLYSSNGGSRSFGIVYGPNNTVFPWGDWSNWNTVSFDLNRSSAANNNFDPTHVVRMHLSGTHWTSDGVGADYIEIRNLKIVNMLVVPAVANAGPDQVVAGTCGTITPVTLVGSSTGGGLHPVWTSWDTYWFGWTASGWNPTVNLTSGDHYMTLSVIDPISGAKASDTVKISVGGATANTSLVLSMTSQTNHYGTGYDLIGTDYGSFFQEIPAALGLDPDPTSMRQWLGGGWYYFTPTIRLYNGCFEPMDLSNSNISLTVRFLQDPVSYADPNTVYDNAGISLLFIDVNGNLRFINTAQPDPNTPSANSKWWVYGPSYKGVDPNFDPGGAIMNGTAVPPWVTYSNHLYFDDYPSSAAEPRGWETASFDATKVVVVEFWGDDSKGSGYDFIDIRNLSITPAVTVLCGDANCDGLVNNGDIDAFVMALTDPVNYASTYGCTDNCDTNGDTLVNNGDIDSFVAAVVGGGCP